MHTSTPSTDVTGHPGAAPELNDQLPAAARNGSQPERFPLTPGHPDNDPLDELLMDMYRVKRLVHYISKGDDVLDRASMSVLWTVALAEDPRPGAIAHDLGLDMSTVSRHISSLERQGLVSKNTDPTDRRACQVRLTEDGMHKLERVRDARRRLFGQALQQWPEQDRRLMSSLLHRLADDFEDMVAAAGGSSALSSTTPDENRYTSSNAGTTVTEG